MPSYCDALPKLLTNGHSHAKGVRGLSQMGSASSKSSRSIVSS